MDGRTDRYDKANSHFSQYSKHEENILEFMCKSHFTSCLKKGEGRKKKKIKFMPNAFSTIYTKKEYYYEIHYK